MGCKGPSLCPLSPTGQCWALQIGTCKLEARWCSGRSTARCTRLLAWLSSCRTVQTAHQVHQAAVADAYRRLQVQKAAAGARRLQAPLQTRCQGKPLFTVHGRQTHKAGRRDSLMTMTAWSCLQPVQTQPSPTDSEQESVISKRAAAQHTRPPGTSTVLTHCGGPLM